MVKGISSTKKPWTQLGMAKRVSPTRFGPSRVLVSKVRAGLARPAV